MSTQECVEMQEDLNAARAASLELKTWEDITDLIFYKLMDLGLDPF